MPILIQPSFARGELSPALYGRVDTAAYRVALRTAWNVIIRAAGGAYNRPGLEFVGPVKNHQRTVRLIPFKFKTTDTYILEFGHLYMRVVRNDAHVAETAQAITNITQASPGVVTITGHGYSDNDEVALVSIGGMTELNGRRVKIFNVTTDTFELLDQATGLNIDTSGFTAYTSGGSALRVYEITTPYAEADLDTLKFTQSADVMTLTHPSHQPRELSRTDHDAWTLTEIQFQPRQVDPTGLTATQNGTPASTTYKYRVTAIADETFEESLPAVNNASVTISGATQANPVVATATAHGFADGEEVEITGVVGMTELNDRRFTVDNQTANTFELKGEDGTGHTAYSSGGTARLTLVKVTNGAATLSATDNISVSWTEAANAQRYAVYKDDNGLYGLLGETEDATYTDDGSKSPDLASTPPRVREPFRGTDNAPATVGYYEQRRVFGGANNRSDTSDFSRTGDQSNFTTSTPARADDAMRVTLDAQEVNEIRHYVPLDHLLVLTSGEEWRIDSGDDSRFSIDTLRQKPQTAWGSSHVRPVKFGRVILHVQENDKVVRSIGYELATDGYVGTDMSLLAEHMFRDHTIVDSASGRTPDPLSYYVRSDGRVAVLTFNQEQEVIGWSRWGTRTPDKFENVAVVRPAVAALSNPKGGISGGSFTTSSAPATEDDAAYFVVKRRMGVGVFGTIDTRRYIERTHSRQFTDVRDCFFVDSGLSYDDPVTVTNIQKGGLLLGAPDFSLASTLITLAESGQFSVGDEVDIDDVVWEVDRDEVDNETQPVQLNGGRYSVKQVSASWVEIENLDGTAVDATNFNAYVEGGVLRKAVSELSGFHHLASQTVTALADGTVLRDLAVSATGGVTLPRKYSRVHLGLSFYSDAELLDIEVAGAGTIQGQLKNVHQVVLRLDRTVGMWVGPTSADLIEMKWRRDERYGTPVQPFTGDKEVDLLPSWNSNGRVFMRQRDPLPFGLLAVIPRFEMEGASEE